MSELQELKEFDGRNLRSLILSFKAGKTCAEDNLVAEMLKQLDIDILDTLADIFKLRIMNHPSEEEDESWKVVMINLIPKKIKPRTIKDFRPIAILSVLCKLYSKLLDWLTGGELVRTRAIQYAFKPGHQCHEPIFIMRRIIEIALEWQTHVFILDGDITKAYDYTQHTLILEALSQRGIPEILSAAILREVARPKGKLRLGGRDSARILQRNRALWQGEPMAPKLFNLTLDQVAVKFENEAKRRKWGWPITVDGRTSHLCLILFADNYWLICTSAKELQDANDFWQKCLKEAGWHTPANELRYGTTLQDDAKASGPVFNNGIQIEHVPRAKGFKALGTQLTFDNRQDAELDRRISAGWGAFYKHAEILCCRSVDLRKRLHYMTKVINPAVF